MNKDEFKYKLNNEIESIKIESSTLPVAIDKFDELTGDAELVSIFVIK